MVKIAICDDEKQERQLIIDWLQQENISKFDIDEYGSADDLLREGKERAAREITTL